MGNNQSANIKKSIVDLGVNERDFQQRAVLYATQAKNAASKRDLVLARSCLRMKHRTEQKRISMLEVREKLMAVEQDIEIQQIMNTSFTALKGAVKVMRSFAKAADVNKIDGLMNELEGLTQDVADASTAIANFAVVESDEDIEIELQSIIATEELKKLPVPPAETPFTELVQIDEALTSN